MGNVFITGVSSGLGKAFADYYLTEGETVFGLSRRKPEALMGNEKFSFQPVDLAKLGAIPKCLDRLLPAEPLELVILNAGIIGTFGDLSELPLAEAKHVEDVNLWANKVIFDYLISRKFTVGQVVAISSGASVKGMRGWSAYGISKAALNMLVKLYAHEMPATHLCSMAPGIIETDMQDYLCGLEPGDDYEVIGSLKSARENGYMPSPPVVAAKIAGSFAKIRETATSGAYVDIRELS